MPVFRDAINRMMKSCGNSADLSLGCEEARRGTLVDNEVSKACYDSARPSWRLYHPIMPFDQGQFDFDAPGTDAGWRRWREELAARQQAFEARWGVVLGKRVTIWLRHHSKPITGKLEWLERETRDPKAPPRFKIGTIEFAHDEIESLVKES